MLIPSHRHRPEDLRLWAELEEADRVRGRSALSRKVDRSLDAIREFVAAGPCYCSVSWGKDSVVVAHLCRRVSSMMPMLWVRWPQTDNPDSARVRDAFADPHAVEVVAPDDDDDNGRQGFSLAVRVAGTDRRITGLRADESGARRLSLRHHGISTDRSCRPLAWWTIADVFGYLALHDLPVHPVYAMMGGGRWPRDRLRVDSLGGSRGTQYGRAQWEAEYYGDVLNRLAAQAV